MWFNTFEHISNGYKGFEKFYPVFKRGIFLDTAPLFLLICGHYDEKNGTNLLKNFNANTIHNRDYQLYDYLYLKAFLKSIGNTAPLIITPHIFTEFIKHLWEIVVSPKQFRDILETSFKISHF